MKHSSSSSTTTTLFALFLLSATITTSRLPSAAADFVLDQEGQPLRNGGSYYLLPVIRGSGGGPALAKTGNETCPVSVVQSPFETSLGLPVRISSPARIAHIYDGLILTLSFTPESIPDCAPSPSRWTIVNRLPDGASVKLGGYDGDDTVDGWFKIVIARRGYYGDDYMLTFCRVDGECGDLAVHVDDNGVRQLVVTEDDENKNKNKNSPFIVQFRRARRHHHHHAFADDA